ncbi:MAG: RNA ligase family protein [Bacteroidales bacterium]|jgi:hypothetical protein|nr:RNA ligase family protein [Candidatus Cloacimonadota bacterium]MCB5269268.1 RNA ligase family protein [Candidatus Cloacimonadota bacterium]MDD3299457.1 RNA ligase family protein [Bacteroidales bacterium]
MISRVLGYKAYDHIAHLPGSGMNASDHLCTHVQARIALQEPRDAQDSIIVQEKIDGSNVAVAKINYQIVPLLRTGYRAETSKYWQHYCFASWVLHPKRWIRFNELLEEGERLCGEWLMQAHGTRYQLHHEPFVAFDLMRGTERLVFSDFILRVTNWDFTVPNTVSIGGSVSIDKALDLLNVSGHGAIDQVEGAVWRVERNCKEVDFVVKYVRPDKVDGLYLPSISGEAPVYNWLPDC